MLICVLFWICLICSFLSEGSALSPSPSKTRGPQSPCFLLQSHLPCQFAFTHPTWYLQLAKWPWLMCKKPIPLEKKARFRVLANKPGSNSRIVFLRLYIVLTVGRRFRSQWTYKKLWKCSVRRLINKGHRRHRKTNDKLVPCHPRTASGDNQLGQHYFSSTKYSLFIYISVYLQDGYLCFFHIFSWMYNKGHKT